MKSLRAHLAIFACSITLAMSAAPAQASSLLSLRGGVGGQYSALNVGGHLTGILGWYSPEEYPPDVLHILELYVGAPYFASGIKGAADQAALQFPTTSTTQLALAPGVRFLLRTGRLQPFFALHLGWFPSNVSTTEKSLAAANLGAIKSTESLFYPATLGLNVESGARYALTDRASIGLGAAFLEARQLTEPGSWKFSWQAFAELTIDLGSLRPLSPS
jgi:hypothetical protein